MNNITKNLTQSIATTALVLASSSIVHASPLTGSGDHLVIDSSTPDFPEMEFWAYSNVVGNSSFDAGWSNSVLPAWRGSLSATGPILGAGSPSGTTIMDFDGLPSNKLSAGTFFNFSDLDGGSGSEWFTLQAFDDDNMLIETPWLSEIVGVRYINGSAPAMNDMPSWSFIDGEYRFVGNHTGSNPNDLFALTSLMTISSLEFNRGNAFNGFSLGAPVPTPGSASLIAIGSVLMTRRRR